MDGVAAQTSKLERWSTPNLAEKDQRQRWATLWRVGLLALVSALLQWGRGFLSSGGGLPTSGSVEEKTRTGKKQANEKMGSLWWEGNLGSQQIY